MRDIKERKLKEEKRSWARSPGNDSGIKRKTGETETVLPQYDITSQMGLLGTKTETTSSSAELYV